MAISFLLFTPIAFAEDIIVYEYFNSRGYPVSKEFCYQEFDKVKAIADFNGPLNKQKLPLYDNSGKKIKWPYKEKRIIKQEYTADGMPVYDKLGRMYDYRVYSGSDSSTKSNKTKSKYSKGKNSSGSKKRVWVKGHYRDGNRVSGHWRNLK